MAGSFSASVSERIEYSTNATRNTNEIDDTIFNTTLNLGYNNDSEKYPTVFSAQATHQEYVNNTFGDQVNYIATLNSVLRSAKQRFQWNISDIYRTVNIDTINPDTPDNSEDTNYFSTGPDWYILRNSRTSLLWSYRHEDFYFQTSDADRRDDMTSLRLSRNISRRTSVGLSAMLRKSEPKNVSDVDIQRTYYGLFLRRIARTSVFNLQLGQSEYEVTRLISGVNGNVENISKTDGASYRVEYTNRITANSNFNLTFSRSLSDSTDRLILNIADTSIDIPAGQDLNAPGTGAFIQERVTASYNARTGWGNLSLTATYNDDDYVDDTLDTTSLAAIVNMNIPVSNRTSYGILYTFSEQERPGGNPPRDFKEHSIRASISRRIETSLRLTFSLTYRERTDTNPGLSYDETRAIIDVAYKL